MSNFWPIKCLSCGIFADLLTDKWKRIICRECLNREEFKEVESEIHSDSYFTIQKGRSVLVRNSDNEQENDSDSRTEELNELDGEE